MNNLKNEWFGKIPSDWKLERLQWHIEEINEKNNPIKTTNILSLTNKLGVVPYSEKGNQGNNSKEDYTQYKIAYKNTIVANSMNVLIGSVGLSKYYGCVSPVYYVYKAKENENIEFYNYLFQTREFQKELRKYANGILEIRLRVSSDDILKRIVPVPSYEEQKEIVHLLNKKVELINRLIKNQEDQIKALEENKTIMISEYVSKGIEINSSLIDSNVKWIGKIPNDWKTIKIKFTSWLKGRIGWDGLKSTEFIDEGPYLITGTDFENGGINRNSCVHITEKRYAEDELLHIKENDLLITKDGTIGKLAIVKNCPDKVSLNSGVMIIRNTKKFAYVDKYLYYVLMSSQFKLWYELSQSGNSTIKHLYQGQFYDFEFTYPPLDIQNKIVEILNIKCSLIDSLIEKKINKIVSLNEYKQSLIYEFVTGKNRINSKI